MAIMRWQPLHEFDSLRKEMDRLFNDFYRSVSKGEEGFDSVYPLMDVKETKDEFVITAEIPGVSKDDVKISIVNNQLTIKGEKKCEKKENDEKYHRVERAYGSFQRSFTLPNLVDSNKIKASFKDGVLTVILPKKEEVKPKEISISVS